MSASNDADIFFYFIIVNILYYKYLYIFLQKEIYLPVLKPIL
jgi:hypothetical protein